MNYAWHDLEMNLANEIGVDLADRFVQSLIRESSGDIDVATRLYSEVGMAWSAILVAWRDWIIARAKHQQPMLVMRDAKPLAVIGISEKWPRIWLNRENCGIEDEISGSATSASPLLSAYLSQNGLNKPFTFVDTGCWGTIVKDLHLRLGMRFQPLYFFSHNPAIPGFLNEIGVDEKIGEVLNDSLECCFPNLTARPGNFIKTGDGTIAPELVSTDPLSRRFGRSALAGVRVGSRNITSVDPLGAVERLIELSEKAWDGSFTGMLPWSSPTWSHGEGFLMTWPSDLVWT